jgi:hypothetical protein
LAVLAVALPASAQTGGPTPGASTKFTGFLCQIDLVDDNNAYNFNVAPYVSSEVANGVVYTLASEKLCTNSETSENIKITCSAKIPNWTGPAVTQQNVTCAVGGAACGILGPGGDPGQPLPAINNKLAIDAAGNAVLTCQVK